MFLALWNYLTGYVIISVTGYSVERFVNLAAQNGIFIWDIRPIRRGVTMKVSIRGFKYLKLCAKKTRCGFKIEDKRGLPFFINKCKKRVTLSAGVLVFVICLYALSSFVWTVAVEGNERIEAEELLDFCSERGLEAGRLKFNINEKLIGEELIANFDDISWVSIEIIGTKANIKVVETIEKMPMIDRTTPTDLIAAKDGIIESVITSTGTPLVKQKDVVAKGEILVSGEVVKMAEEVEVGREYVRSQAKVTARVWYEIEAEVETVYSEKVYSGIEKADTSLVIGNKVLNMIKPNISYKEFDTYNMEDRVFSIGDYVFPVYLKKEVYREYVTEEKTRTEEEAKKMLEEIVNERIFEITDGTNILDMRVEYFEIGNTLRVKAMVEVIERIDEEVIIDFSGSDVIDEQNGESGQH